jgi:hypothetical protein
MSYLRYLCLFAYSGVNAYCVVFFFVYVASFSGLSIFDCPFGILLTFIRSSEKYNKQPLKRSGNLTLWCSDLVLLLMLDSIIRLPSFSFHFLNPDCRFNRRYIRPWQPLSIYTRLKTTSDSHLY